MTDNDHDHDSGHLAAPAATGGRWRARIARTLAAALKDRTQLLEMLLEAQHRGILDADAFTMLEGVLAVAELQVRDIMVPRTQMICIRRDDASTHILAVALESKHSRFPVVDGDRDDVVGILMAKDLLRLCEPGQRDRFDMREFLRPAAFVPESKRLNVLLKEFRGNRNHMAIVIDEYSGVAGLVTIEDVIEQIVGDIDDEFDIEDDQNIRFETERQYTVRGSTRISEFNEFFDAALPESNFDTVAGLVMQQFGRVPRRGESVTLGAFEFRIARTDRRRIDSLRVITAAPPTTAQPG